MNEKYKKIYHKILLILSLGLIVGLIYYIHKNSATFVKLKSIDINLVLMLIGLHAFNYLLLGITHFYPLKKHNIHLKFKEWYGLCTVSELFNMLLPAKGGTAVRMMYIHEEKKLPIAEFVSMGLAVVLVGFSLLGIVGTVYCHFFLEKNQTVFIVLESIFAVITMASLLLIFASNAIGKIFKLDEKYSLEKYLSDKKLVLVSLLCYLGMFIIYPMKVYLSFKAIGIIINPIDSFEISLILLASSCFQILPGNIGIKEVATAYIAQQYGINFEVALLASLVDRAILLLFIFPFGAYFYWTLFLDASFSKINWQRMGASSRIPLIKRLVKDR